MSTHVIGIMDSNDSEYQKMRAVVEACHKAGVSIPDDVYEWFATRGAEDIDSSNGAEEALYISIPHHKWNNGDMQAGFEVVVAEIPKGVKKIRFFNSF